jgi:hypothetical protein
MPSKKISEENNTAPHIMPSKKISEENNIFSPSQ